MAINWDSFHEDLDEAIRLSGERTDKKLAGKISNISRLTDEEVKKLFPAPADVKVVAELLQIVRGAGEKADKINNLISNSEKFAAIIITLLAKLT